MSLLSEEDITYIKQISPRLIFAIGTCNSIIETQCKKISTEFKYPVLILRDLIKKEISEETELGQQMKEHFESHTLIPEDAKRVLSREEVTEIEDQLYNWTDKAIIEALFEGLSGNSMCDLTGVEMHMINQEKKQLMLPDGRVFDLTDRLCELLIKACLEEDYVCYGETLRVKKLLGKNKIYKERDNAHAADSEDKFFRWVYRRIMNCRKFVGIDGLTMKNLQTAGMVHYLKLGLANTNLSLKEFLLTENGQKLMDKYNYCSDHRVDNVIARYKQFV